MHYLPSRLVFLLLLAGVCAQGTIEHRYGPEDMAVRQGETATLHCAVNNKGDNRVFWYRIGAGTGEVLSQDTHVSQGSRPSMGRYVIVGNHQDGEYNLQITNAQHEDSGNYRCAFEDEQPENHSYEDAHLSVMVPPTIGTPNCILMTTRNEIGHNTQLSCLSSGGDPPATLTWQRNGQPITNPSTERNILNRIMLVEDVGATFTCVAESAAMDEMRSCTLLPLRQLPAVMVSPRVGYASVGGSVTFTCQKQHEDINDSYVWYINDNKILPDNVDGRRFRLSGDKRSLSIGRVQSQDDDAEIVCKVDNGSIAVGATATLSVRGVNQVYSTELSKANIGRQTTVPLPVSPTSSNDRDIPVATDDSKTALIAVSVIGGLAIAVLVAIIYMYIQRKLRAKRQVAVPMTPVPRKMSQSSFGNLSVKLSIKSFQRSANSSKSVNSSHEAYAALNMMGVHDVNYEDLKGTTIDKSYPVVLRSAHTLTSSACALPLPPISPSAPPLSIRITSDTEFEDAESVDSYETIDEKILRPYRTENESAHKTSEYLEILP